MGYTAMNGRMIVKMMNWKGCERRRSWPILRFRFTSCVERLRKITKTLSEIYVRDRDTNTGLPGYKSGKLTIRSRRSVIRIEESHVLSQLLHTNAVKITQSRPRPLLPNPTFTVIILF